MDLAITRILVPLDFSAESTRVLDYAHALAQEFNASLHLLHVCEVPSMAGGMDAYATIYAEWSGRLGEEAAAALARYRARLAGVNVSTEVQFGNPARAIIKAAHVNDVDLIVMGTHGHGALMHLMLGNVAERVVRTADCPVLTVRARREPEAEQDAAGAAATDGQ